MRFPPNWSMELLLVVALFVSVVVAIYAMHEPPGDRTRFTLERSEAPRAIGERPIPLTAQDTGLRGFER
jgi:hypothetical protein